MLRYFIKKPQDDPLDVTGYRSRFPKQVDNPLAAMTASGEGLKLSPVTLIIYTCCFAPAFQTKVDRLRNKPANWRAYDVFNLMRLLLESRVLAKVVIKIVSVAKFELDLIIRQAHPQDDHLSFL